MHRQPLKLTQIRYLNYERGLTLKYMDSQFVEGCRYCSISKPQELCPAWSFTTYAYTALLRSCVAETVRDRQGERERSTALYLILQRPELMNRKGMLWHAQSGVCHTPFHFYFNPPPLSIIALYTNWNTTVFGQADIIKQKFVLHNFVHINLNRPGF